MRKSVKENNRIGQNKIENWEQSNMKMENGKWGN